MKTKKVKSNLNCSLLIARLSIALLFLVSLWGKLSGFSGQVGWVGSMYPAATFLVLVAILMELFGVFSLVLGWKLKQGALVLALYTVLATLMFHIGDGEMMNFLKNLAIFGGLIALSNLSPGKYSLDLK